MQLDEITTQALLKALHAQSAKHGLGMDLPSLAAAEQPHPSDASFYLHQLFPLRTVSHAQEMGEAPGSAYPRLLAMYAKASGGEFDPHDIDADSDDSWASLSLLFRHGGKKQRIKVGGVQDSDWFAPDFVKALNRFAKRVDLPGRWVDFHNGEDACTSIYVPAEAQTRFTSLKKKYSTVPDSEDDGCTPEQLAEAMAMSLAFPPALEVRLDKEQLALRKAAWPQVEASLRERHSKSDTKLFERYYLSAAEPKPDLWESDPIPLVYRLWLHPDQSDAGWCAVTDRVLSYEGKGDSLLERQRFVDRSLHDSSTMLARDGSPSRFGDTRERLLQFLMGETAPGERYRHQGERLYYHGSFNNVHYPSLYNWLDAPTVPPDDGRPKGPAPVGNWVDHLCGPYFERFMLRGPDYMPLDSFKEYLYRLARYAAPVEGHADFLRQHYCQQRRDALDARVLPEPLAGWWAQMRR